MFIVRKHSRALSRTKHTKKQIRTYLIIQCHQIQLQTGKLNLSQAPEIMSWLEEKF